MLVLAETVVVEDRPVKLARLRQDPQEYAKSMQSKNTVLSTKYGFKTYNETMKGVAKHLKQKHYDLHEVPAEELPDRLAKFFMHVEKKKGGSLNASTLGTIYQSLVRYLLEEHPLKVDIRTDPRFSVVLKNMKAAQKESCQDGEVPGKNKMEPLQEHHIAKCWTEGSFGRDSPKQLLRTVYMITVSNLGFRANEECHNLLNEDIVMGEKSTHGVPEKVTVSERVTKTRQGQKNQSRDCRPTMYADHENPDICPVRTFMAYQMRKTEAQRDGKQRFFLNVKQSAVRDPKKEEKWYATSPMSSKEIAKLLPNALKEIGIDTKVERLGNTSLRKSLAENLVKAEVPAVVIQQKAGHASAKSMNSYAKGGTTAHKAASLIMTRTMGGKKAEKFGNMVEELEASEEGDQVAEASSTHSKKASPSPPSNFPKDSWCQPNLTTPSYSSNQATPFHNQASSTQGWMSPQQPQLGLPYPGFQMPSMASHGAPLPALNFQQQILLAQQQSLLGLAAHPLAMLPFPQQQLLHPHPAAFGLSSPHLPLHPNYPVRPNLTPDVSKQLADLKQQHQDELDQQKKLMEAQLEEAG